MTDLPTRRHVRWSVKPDQRATDGGRMRRDDSAAAGRKADLFLVFAICAIGLLATLNVMLRFPDLGALIASYNQF